MARILIAEDDEPVRGFVKRALEMDGHAVVAAADGAEALERLEQEGGAFDLLLSDIRMPLMDGIALALAAGRGFPKLPILLMTGFADQRERAHDLEAIIEDVVTKPFSLAEIRAAVGRVLAKGKSAGLAA
jgi:CheY-like chemotaxis protein